MKAIAIIIGVLLASVIFLRFYPTFGAKPSAADMERFQSSPHYREGDFVNQKAAPMNGAGRTTFSILKDFIKGNPRSRPQQPLPVETVSPDYLRENLRNQAIWLGHSTFLLRMNGKLLLLDPMLGQTPSPLAPLGGKRYSDKLPVDIADLPRLDAVLVSHDHYDHLDYATIKKIHKRVGHFFVPLGVGSHLQKWGVPAEKISEGDWWQEFEYEGLRLTCTPARHFSGRKLSERNSTLWCSWAIAAPEARIFFSGDGGYGPHFKEIGQRYGPFDLTLMECGQYDKRWAAIHMTPEQTVQAHVDLQGKVLLPMHWAAFTLALHDWTDPIERVSKAASDQAQAITTPKIGEPVYIGAADYPRSRWWE